MRERADWLLDLADRNGLRPRVTSTYRSWSQQSALYQRYLEGRSQFPAAPPGRSKHQYGLAFDVVVSPEGLRWLGSVWESLGGRWGGRFKDPIHFEAP